MSGKGEGWGSRPLLTPNALSAVAAPSSPFSFLFVLSQLKQEAEESREGGRRKAPLQTRLKPSLPHLHTQSLSPSLPCFQSFLPRRLFLLPLSLHRQAPKLDQRISNRQNLLLSVSHTASAHLPRSPGGGRYCLHTQFISLSNRSLEPAPGKGGKSGVHLNQQQKSSGVEKNCLFHFQCSMTFILPLFLHGIRFLCILFKDSYLVQLISPLFSKLPLLSAVSGKRASSHLARK